MVLFKRILNDHTASMVVAEPESGLTAKDEAKSLAHREHDALRLVGGDSQEAFHSRLQDVWLRVPSPQVPHSCGGLDDDLCTTCLA